MKAASVLLAMLLLVTSGKVLASNVDNKEVRQQEVTCLASNIWYESRGETTKGQLAVGLVTINRAKDDDYSDTICGVIREKGQFSWYKPGSIRPRSDAAYKKVENLAQTLYDEYYIAGTFDDFTQGATHFHNVGVKPNWPGYKLTLKVGPHAFFKKNNK